MSCMSPIENKHLAFFCCMSCMSPIENKHLASFGVQNRNGPLVLTNVLFAMCVYFHKQERKTCERSAVHIVKTIGPLDLPGSRRETK